MIRPLTISQGETLRTCWIFHKANGGRAFKLGRASTARAKSLIVRGFLTKRIRGRCAYYTVTSLGVSVAALRFSAPKASKAPEAALATATRQNRSRPVSGELEALRADVQSRDRRIVELEAELSEIYDRAVPATDGKPGGPGEGSSASSSPSAGPPGAVTFPSAKLTLEVKVDLNMPVPEELALQVSRLLGDWSNGRKPFAVEEMERGLLDVVRMAVYHAVEVKQREIYGYEMVSLGNGSQSSRACLEAERWSKDMRLRVRGDMECTGAEESARSDDT